MYKGKTILGIIPARAGSKRLLNKHLLDFNGKSLIEHSILETLKSKYLDETIVTTDCKQILRLVNNYDLIPLERPPELATDEAKTYGFVKHAIDSSQKNYDYVVLLQATSPLRFANHIDEAIEMIVDKRANSIISVSKARPSPLWANTLAEDLSMNNFISAELANTRGQDLPVYYRLNGALYLSKIEAFLHHKDFLQPENSYAYIMQEENGIDIDTEVDLELAKLLYKKMQGKQIFTPKNVKKNFIDNFSRLMTKY